MSISEYTRLFQEAAEYGLEGVDEFGALPTSYAASLCNGIGPGWLPARARELLDRLCHDFQSAALIHDLRYAFAVDSGYSERAFDAANDELERNCKKIAKAKYGFWNWRRYCRLGDARVIANICRKFGWRAWTAKED